MSSLQGQKVRLTYRDLLQVSNSNSGIDATLRTVTDGEATTSPLQLSTTNISLNGSVWPTGYGNASQVLSTDGAGTLSWSNQAAAVPTTITVANEATDTTCFPAFFTAATGDLGPKTNAGLTFNSNTGVLAATGFSGPLTGNVTGNADTVTTNANLTGPITSVGNATSIASQTGTGTKFVVDTSPTLVTPVLGVATATTINKVALTAPATGSTLTIADGQTLTVNGSATITNGTHSGTNTGDQNLFSTIAVSGQSDIVADAASDTLTIVAGANITLTTNAGTDTLTIAAGAGGSLSDADYGDVTVSGGGSVFTVDSVTVADAAGDATTWPMLSRTVTGASQVVSTDPGLTYDASTNSLATTTFVGALTGNASTATALATARAIGGVNFDGTAAITPANITIANEGTDTTCFPLFTTAATGDLPPKSNAALTYNSNTGNLGSTTFTGALVGNVTGNVSGSSGSTTGNAATVTTNANLTGPITSVGNATSIASQTGTGTKFVVDTSPTLVTPILGVASATSINTAVITAPTTTVGGNIKLLEGTNNGTNTLTIQAPASTADVTATFQAVTGDIYVSGGTDIPVADGGTGVSTMTTAYAPVCAGTTATGALQVASTGLSTSGYVLTSNGASALPSFQAAAGGGAACTYTVNQTTHGFAVGDLVKCTGATTYAKAQGDSAANAEVIGIVSVVADANNFTLHVAGQITTLSGLTAGTVYFLSPSLAGAATSTAPTTVGQVNKPAYIAISTTAAVFTNQRGQVVS